MPDLKKNICVHRLPDHGPNRSIMLNVTSGHPAGEHQHGTPVRLLMDVRPSTTAHGRLKITFGVQAEELETGEPAFATACEFRLEMN